MMLFQLYYIFAYIVLYTIQLAFPSIKQNIFLQTYSSITWKLPFKTKKRKGKTPLNGQMGSTKYCSLKSPKDQNSCDMCVLYYCFPKIFARFSFILETLDKVDYFICQNSS